MDPILMAASTITRLQGIVSRKVAPVDSAVVTVGSVHAGSKDNIIPARAELLVNVRTFDSGVRRRVLDAITRIVEAESAASGAPKAPEISPVSTFPLTVNDEPATARVRSAIGDALGQDRVLILPPTSGSEDFGLFGTTLGAPSVFWFTGGVDPAETETYLEALARGALPEGAPGNHSPHFAPCVEPAIEAGVRSLHAAALAWLGHP